MNKVDLTLYLVTERYDYEEQHFLEIIDTACRSGVTILQLREKENTGLGYLELARKVKQITDRYGIPLIIDDRADIAMAVDAAGVHVGAEDLPVAVVRKLLGPGKIVGATAKTVAQAQAAQREGADYLGVGAIYPTTTKVKTRLTAVSTLNEISAAVTIPVAAIGGLNEDNLGILEDSPINGICVVSAVMKAGDVGAKVRSLVDGVTAMKGYQRKQEENR